MSENVDIEVQAPPVVPLLAQEPEPEPYATPILPEDDDVPESDDREPMNADMLHDQEDLEDEQ